MATEKLSGYLERDITSESVNDIKQKVQDKYRYFIEIDSLNRHPLSCLLIFKGIVNNVEKFY